MLLYARHVRTPIDLLAPFRRRILPSNEHDDTITLPAHEDDAPTVELPVTIPGATEPVRASDRSGPTIVVGSVMFRDDPTTVPLPVVAATGNLPTTKPTAARRRVTGPGLIRVLFASNMLVICFAVGLFLGGLWTAYEVGVIPDSVTPDFLKSESAPRTTPVPTKTPDKPRTSSPSYRQPTAGPTTVPSKKSSSPRASTSASPSASTSPSTSASASAQPEASSSATQPASSETTAPAITPSASAPSPTESSTEGEPTSPASDTATPPTSETGSASPEATAETSVNP